MQISKIFDILLASILLQGSLCATQTIKEYICNQKQAHLPMRNTMCSNNDSAFYPTSTNHRYRYNSEEINKDIISINNQLPIQEYNIYSNNQIQLNYPNISQIPLSNLSKIFEDAVKYSYNKAFPQILNVVKANNGQKCNINIVHYYAINQSEPINNITNNSTVQSCHNNSNWNYFGKKLYKKKIIKTKIVSLDNNMQVDSDIDINNTDINIISNNKIANNNDTINSVINDSTNEPKYIINLGKKKLSKVQKRK
ncbi:MAG: hypothetical protein IJU54_00090 [Alphaproteobacteria bacterium]|nr:hypothetical protein [Alphaproteobacteria bacterium]